VQPLKIGVIGCGYWGPNLVRNFAEMPETEVLAVADLDEGRLAAMQKRYLGLVTTRDYRQFFDLPLDAVAVATPPAAHYAVARDCLERGLHVMVEKPLTLNSQDGQALCELADRLDLTLMVGHTFEYNPAVRVIKEAIVSGELGQVFYIDMVRVNLGLFQDNLDVVWDLAPHDISILRYLLGSEPISVNAAGAACILPNVHDVAYLYLEFPNNVRAHIHVSWLDPCKVRRITVVGSKKMLVFDDVEPLEKIRIYDKGVEKPPYTNTFGDFQLSYRFGDIVIPRIPLAEPLREECKHFIDCVIHHTRPQSSGWDGLQVVKTLEMADRSLKSQGARQTMALDPKAGEDAARHDS